MIWTITHIDDVLRQAFVDAGPLDQAAIDQHVARKRLHLPPERRPGVKRYYYLLADNPRVSLCCVGMPLSAWTGGAFLIVGTREIIGEFAGNRACKGKLGLQLKMQPIAWMSGETDQHFTSGMALLDSISEQVLDRKEIERSQEVRKKRYEWKDRR